MFNKRIITLMLVVILALSSVVVQASAPNIDKSKLGSGIVSINYKSTKGVTTAVRIVKGDQKQDHVLNGDNSFPLQFGEGDYTITLLENVEGKKFRQVESEIVTLKSTNKNDVYLQSIQMISWNKDMNSVKKAEELTKNAKTDKEKVNAIYNYIVNNISYDNNKASSVKAGYVPSIDETLKSSQAICYDYSALFAGMLRSLDIPTKLVMGRNNDIKEYHAWNQVYLQDTNEWITIDTTYDAGMKKGDKVMTMMKDDKEYKVEKEY